MDGTRRISHEINLKQETTTNESPLKPIQKHSTATTPQQRNGLPMFLRRIQLRLNTSHDKFKLHKIFGISCGLHYFYRFYVLLAYDRTYFGNNDNETFYFTLFVLLWHMLLPITSLMFRVLKYRNPEYWLMIWKEYRLHVIIFTFRSVSVALLSLFLSASVSHVTTDGVSVFGKINKSTQDTFSLHFIKFATVMLCHKTADWVTATYGDPNVSTIRCHDGTKKNEKLVAWDEYLVKRFYALSQFVAIAALVHPHESATAGIDCGFGMLYPIHFASFLMTLQKAGIIDYKGYTVGYSLALIVGTVYYSYHMAWTVYLPVILMVYLARVHLRMDKYMLWMAFFVYCRVVVSVY